ncbi:MAG: phosphatidate cytidylyltransferase [Bacteroidales bacterium]|nr:phosphatidate cytidylyltransferase [Bacteroidales bacterium]
MNTTVKRTLSGTVFLGVMLAGLLFHPALYAVLFICMSCGMLVEFYRITMGKRYMLSRILAIVLGGATFMALFGITGYGLPNKLVGISALLLLAIMISTLFEKDRSDFSITSYIYTGLLYIAVPLALANFVVFRGGSFNGVLMVAFFCIIWAGDVGAYCFGMLFGQKGGKKLFPSISPKKSWAGFWGGLFLAAVASVILFFTGLFPFPWWHCLLLAVIMNVLGVFGDLFESQWKRSFSVKDSGDIIPGHGGLMDRFDSAIFAIPAGFIYLAINGLV